MEVHWHTEETPAPYHTEQEMGPGKVSAVGHLASSWQQLQHQIPCKLDSTHGLLEVGEEEVTVMKGLGVLSFLADLGPTAYEPRVSFQNARLIC